MMILQKILLIRTDRIGDVILTIPLISVLREVYPQAHISFLTRSYTAPLLKYQKTLNEIIIYQPENQHKGIIGTLSLSRILKSKNFDIAFLFYPSPQLAIALKLAHIPRRVGSGFRWYSFLFNQRTFEHRKHGKKHELEYNLSLLNHYIPKIPSPSDIRFDFQKNNKLTQLKNKALQKYHIKKNYIIIHPGSGGSSPNLPPRTFHQMIQYLLKKLNKPILVVGDKSEEKLLNEVIDSLCSDRLHLVCGAWDLETYMAVIAQSSLFISNSTGPLHIARAFDVPLIGFYCPAIPCSPERWGPYNKLDSILSPNIEPCKSCNMDKCPYDNCLDLIKWESIQTLLDQHINRLTTS
jgi:heptosyltransferase-3